MRVRDSVSSTALLPICCVCAVRRERYLCHVHFWFALRFEFHLVSREEVIESADQLIISFEQRLDAFDHLVGVDFLGLEIRQDVDELIVHSRLRREVILHLRCADSTHSTQRQSFE